jgi:hypothetical protein
LIRPDGSGEQRLSDIDDFFGVNTGVDTGLRIQFTQPSERPILLHVFELRLGASAYIVSTLLRDEFVISSGSRCARTDFPADLPTAYGFVFLQNGDYAASFFALGSTGGEAFTRRSVGCARRRAIGPLAIQADLQGTLGGYAEFALFVDRGGADRAFALSVNVVNRTRPRFPPVRMQFTSHSHCTVLSRPLRLRKPSPANCTGNATGGWQDRWTDDWLDPPLGEAPPGEPRVPANETVGEMEAESPSRGPGNLEPTPAVAPVDSGNWRYRALAVIAIVGTAIVAVAIWRMRG